MDFKNLFWFLLSGTFLPSTLQQIPSHWTYSAAVYEHRPNLFQINWNGISKTLDTYEQQIEIASKQGARIIVFPEDGIIGMNLNRSQIYPYLQILPNAGEFINPCIDTIPTARNYIQRRLSCAARWNKIYIVANFGTVEFCKTGDECPADGRFQFNTNVVFDSEGIIVAKYHKENLYYESQFDFPPKVEYSIFDSPMGSFGTITCFDMLFKEPVLILLESIGVVNIAFTTAWGNVLPEMFSIGVQESFAIRMGVNLLAANVHIPEIDMQGSGIYSSNKGAIVYYNDYTWLSGGKLLITNVTTPPEGPIEGSVNLPSLKSGNRANFSGLMEGNQFTFVTLAPDKLEDEIYLEDKNTSCYLKYSLIHQFLGDLYAFGIFEGLHVSSLNSYIQVCALVKCANASKYSCGEASRESNTIFQTVVLSGQFSGHYIFPSVLVEKANPSKKDWTFLLDKSSNRASINITNRGNMDPLVTSILYTRLYDKDQNNRTYYKKLHLSTLDSEKRHKWSIESTGHMDNYSNSSHGGNAMVAIIFLVIFAAAVLAALYYRTKNTNGYNRL